MPRQFTVHSLIDHACARLKRARLVYGQGIPGPRDEAAYFVLHALKQPPALIDELIEKPVAASVVRRVMQLVEARIGKRVPAAYLMREAWLGNYRFYVDHRAIVPRSYIAELLEERLAPWLPARRRVCRILDLCTGSACLAIVAAHVFSKASIDAIDIDRGALAVAKRNVDAYKMNRRIRLIRSDLFAAISHERYDLIIANPPYVDAMTMRKLPQEYRHEPAGALASGRDGLDAVRVILREASHHLTPGGLLAVEVGHHRDRVEAAFPRHPFVWPETSGGDDCVFTLERAALVQAASRASAAARPASR